jgi:glycosyltransferase involved in cell wall biosynthesis
MGGVEPMITVVVPAWDLGDELVESVESVLSQDVSVRLVVVDNASANELPATPGERLRLPQRVSVGLARNAGLAVAATKYVFFMDGDDVLLPGTMAYLLERLERDPCLVAAAGSILLWDPRWDRRAPSYYPPAWAYWLQRWPRAFALANVAFNAFPAVGSTLVRTSVARAVGGFPDADFLETWAFGASLTSIGPVSLSPRPCKLYRVRAHAATLKRRGTGDLRLAWRGRREVRRRFLHHWRGSPAIRILLPGGIAVHALQAIREAGRSEPRYTAFLKSSRP